MAVRPLANKETDLMSEHIPLEEDPPVARFSAPPEDEADEYRQLAPGFWLSMMYADFVGDEASVAALGWDGDSPAGGDYAFLDRHGNHYVYSASWTDGPQYVGEFLTTADAVASWRADITAPGTTPTVTTRPENWVGPVSE